MFTHAAGSASIGGRAAEVPPSSTRAFASPGRTIRLARRTLNPRGATFAFRGGRPAFRGEAPAPRGEAPAVRGGTFARQGGCSIHEAARSPPEAAGPPCEAGGPPSEAALSPLEAARSPGEADAQSERLNVRLSKRESRLPRRKARLSSAVTRFRRWTRRVRKHSCPSEVAARESSRRDEAGSLTTEHAGRRPVAVAPGPIAYERSPEVRLGGGPFRCPGLPHGRRHAPGLVLLVARLDAEIETGAAGRHRLGRAACVPVTPAVIMGCVIGTFADKRLSGDRSGQYSIRINDQYRLCFRWKAGYADEVEITDYH
jgi:hypothetical protein